MDSLHKALDNFTPAPGFLLIEPIDDKSAFQPAAKPDDNLSTEVKIGKVLKVGLGYVNNFGQQRSTDLTPGEIVLYSHKYNQEQLEIEFVKYPVVEFEAIRGGFKQ